MSNALTMTARCLRLSRREIDAVIMSLLLPVVIMFMFVELFGGAIETGTSYVRYVVPGVLLLCAGYNAGLTAVGVSKDMSGGMVDRLRSMDVGSTPLLSGHVAASAARNAGSMVLVGGLAFVLGFGLHGDPLGWVAAAGILLAFSIAVSWLSAALGLLARTPEAAGGFTFLIMFLPYASSAFVPVHTMPGWLQGFASAQPITPLADSLRGLLLGTPVGARPLVALAWCAGILIVSVAASRALFERRTA
jgi:ABC-2 type transport system permease protein